jgi:hypothetical protein
MKITPKQYRTCWSKNQEQLNAWKNSKAKSCNIGPSSSLQDIEKELFNFVFKLREQGITDQMSAVVTKTGALLDANFME